MSLLLGIGLSSQAQAETFEQRMAGAVELTARDFLQDGYMRLSGLLAAKGGPGSAQVRVLVEGGSPVAPTGACPSDGFYLQQPVEVAGFIATFNDLSLLSGARGAPGVACVDLVTGNITMVAEGRITGGNGRFEGATGTWQVSAEAEPALFRIGFPLGGIGWRVTGTIVYDLD